MADVSNAIKTIDSHPLEATYFNGKSYDEVKKEFNEVEFGTSSANTPSSDLTTDGLFSKFISDNNDGSTTYQLQQNATSGVKNIKLPASMIDGLEVKEEGEKIYGVDNVGSSDPSAITRTDDSISLIENSVYKDTNGYSVGAATVYSAFDTAYPWSGITQVIDSFGNVFIKIPKFYAKISRNNDGTFKYQVSKTQYDGFTTLFVDGNGNEIDYVMVGKYEGTQVNSSDSNYSAVTMKIASKSGRTVMTQVRRDTARTACMSVGDGYQQYDSAIAAIIKILFIVEFGTTNSQLIMMGLTNNSATISRTGLSDTCTTTTGSGPLSSDTVDEQNSDGLHAMKYRGIENLWGNAWIWEDGTNFNAEKCYVSLDPKHYGDNLTTGTYSYVGDRSMDSGYQKVLTPYVQYPLITRCTTAGEGATGMTYYADSHFASTDGSVLASGGVSSFGGQSGLFIDYGNYDSSDVSTFVGCRLCYKPITSGGGGGGTTVETDTINIKATYGQPAQSTGNYVINPRDLISSDYPIVFFDGIQIDYDGSSVYISKDQLFQAPNSTSVLTVVGTYPSVCSISKKAVSVSTSTVNMITMNNISITLGISGGAPTISLLGRAAKSFTSHAPSGSIGY